MRRELILKQLLFFFLSKALAEIGTVQSVLDLGDIRVRYPSGHVWTMNPEAVVKVKLKDTCQYIIV